MGSNFQIKILTIEPGKRLSDQKHKYRGETWIPLNGVLTVTLDNTSKHVYQGRSLSIESEVWHRLENDATLNGGRLLEILEVQTGTSFEEDDIERRADDFGRV
jgi:mannose-6-phosphate isomerase-like protein (cupin superfamily)